MLLVHILSELTLVQKPEKVIYHKIQKNTLWSTECLRYKRKQTLVLLTRLGASAWNKRENKDNLNSYSYNISCISFVILSCNPYFHDTVPVLLIHFCIRALTKNYFFYVFLPHLFSFCRQWIQSQRRGQKPQHQRQWWWRGYFL